MKMFDTHAHYYFDTFDGKSPFAEDRKKGVTHWVQIGCDEVSSLAAITLAQREPGCAAAVGLHPMDVAEVGKTPRAYKLLPDTVPTAHTHAQLWNAFDAMITTHRTHVVAVGETGFDRHYVDTPERIALQHACFLAHLALADKHNLPIVVHARDADEQLMAFMDAHMPSGKYRFVVHCFSSGPTLAEHVLRQSGGYIGIGGVATYPKAESVREVIAMAPIEKILTETDAPFLVPQGFRKTGKKIAKSYMMQEVIELIAEIKQLPVAACAAQLHANACAFYGIKNRA